jgi:NAD(P)-dependent dehydrogenase (short-subunit alcohol dehydrogenase family)
LIDRSGGSTSPEGLPPWLGCSKEHGASVTGGGSGIGEACGVALAAAGCFVTVAGRTEGKREESVREIVEAGGSAQGVKCDVTVESMVRSAVESVAGDEGQHDVAVNRVGPARRAVSCAPLSLFEFGDTADSWQV